MQRNHPPGIFPLDEDLEKAPKIASFLPRASREYAYINIKIKYFRKINFLEGIPSPSSLPPLLPPLSPPPPLLSSSSSPLPSSKTGFIPSAPIPIPRKNNTSSAIVLAELGQEYQKGKWDEEEKGKTASPKTLNISDSPSYNENLLHGQNSFSNKDEENNEDLSPSLLYAAPPLRGPRK